MTETSATPYAVERKLLKNDEVSITAAFFAAVSALEYDLDVVGMDGEAMLVELQSQVGEISAFNRSKVLLGQGAYFTDVVTSDLPSFIDFANTSLAIDPPRMDVFNPANATESSAAVLEIMLINGYDKLEEANFSDEIRAYWGAILSSEGAAWPIKPLLLALMPTRELSSVPAEVEVIAGRTGSLEKALGRAVWRHATEISKEVSQLLDADGKPSNLEDEILAVTSRLVGPADEFETGPMFEQDD